MKRLIWLLLCSLFFIPVAANSSDYTRTRYPIVLVNGMFGFETTALGLVEYWHRIPQELMRDGAKVYAAQVTGLESSEVRGLELISQLEELQAITGASGFNLVGHSHGGPTSRFVAATRPDLVKSVTSIGSPHKGSPVVDKFISLQDKPVQDRLLRKGFEAIAGLINLFSSKPTRSGQDAAASFQSLSTAGSADFNRRYPAAIPEDCGEGQYIVDGIHYFSWGGTKPFTNPFDPTDYFLAATSRLIDEPSDGLVARCSTHMGMVIRDNYRMNHLDLTNLMFGLHSLLDTDPVAVLRQHANRLKNLGL